METLELKKEQLRLAHKIILRDGFSTVKKIAGIDTLPISPNQLLACVVVCEFPSLKVIEQKSYVLHDPLPFKPGYSAYRDMPAMIEAYNLLENEPDVILVKGEGILHPRKMGVASHLGLMLNKPTIGITPNLNLGKVELGKIIFHNEICGFEVKTREHANPVYVTPGHLITLGSALNIVAKTIVYPHKLPEPLHLVHKLMKRRVRGEKREDAKETQEENKINVKEEDKTEEP
ncbi:endonuclease V [Candidatus Woesearchaeota archaeon]|nr:endonuclease V [Candidatus Woesearchaeota archaeon]